MICPIRIDDDSEDSQSSDDIYNVEFVYGKKLQKQIALYAVKWIGFSIKQMTWEPKTNFTSQSQYLIQRFESRLAYKIYQRQYNPKKETIRVHIKQRFCQVYIAVNKPQVEKQEIQQFTNIKQANRQITQNERKVSKIDDEYEKAQQIIDEWKKNLGVDEEKQENNKLNKQNKKGKKEIKLQQKFSEEILNSPLQQNTKKAHKCQKQKNDSNINKHSIDGDLERDIQLLIEREKQNQLKKQTSKKEKIESINSNNKSNKKSPEKTDQNTQGIQKIEFKSEIKQKIQKKQKNETKTELEQKQNSGGIKANNKKQLKQDPFEIQIDLNDDNLAANSQDIHKDIISQKNKEFQKILIQKQLKVIKSAQNGPELLKHKIQPLEITDNFKDQTQQFIYKSEREYLNDIIVSQRKKELEIYRSGNLIEAIKKDLKSSGQPKTSQQLQEEIQKIQLERIANNKPSRCCVPIVPKLMEQQIQADENELPSVQIKQQKINIGSITSHCMIKNTLIYKCILENGDELNQEFSSLSALCPKMLLDYMKVNSILI